MAKAPDLTERQARFVQEYLVDGNGTQAAIRAGYGAAGARVAAHRAITNVAVQEALQARQRVDAARLALQREDVLAGLLEAIEQARGQRNPMAMISGLREIGKMLGFYAPEVKRVEVSADGEVEVDRLARLSDAELLAIVASGGGGRIECESGPV